MATDAVSLILRDHRDTEKLFAQVQRGGSRAAAAFDKVCAMLIAHGHAEEREVYPEIAKLGGEQHEDVQHSLDDHHEVERMIGQLRTMELGMERFHTLFASLMEAVQEHVHEEEQEMLPRLKQEVSKQRLNALGKAFSQRREAELAKATKRIAKQVKQPAASRGGSPKKRVGRAATTKFATMSKQELYAQAKKANVKGRSTMNKEQLVRALTRSS